MGRFTQYWAAPFTRGSRMLTGKTSCGNKTIGCWLVPSTCMLEIG